MTPEQLFEAFVKRYQDLVFSTALRVVANEAEAEDIAQEVFLRAYQRFGLLSQSPTVVGWLKRVATNLGLNYVSRYRRRCSFFSELFGGAGNPENTGADFAAPGDLVAEIAAAEQHRQVERALRDLPVSQRVPLVLFHLEGFSYKEIAFKLRTSIGKVKTDVFRGRARLRSMLQTCQGRLHRTNKSALRPNKSTGVRSRPLEALLPETA